MADCLGQPRRRTVYNRIWPGSPRRRPTVGHVSTPSQRASAPSPELPASQGEQSLDSGNGASDLGRSLHTWAKLFAAELRSAGAEPRALNPDGREWAEVAV